MLEQQDYTTVKITLGSNEKFASLNLPATPFKKDHLAITEENRALQNVIISILSFNIAMGLYPVVYQRENDGRLVRHVCPLKSAKKQISSQGGELDFFRMSTILICPFQVNLC